MNWYIIKLWTQESFVLASLERRAICHHKLLRVHIQTSPIQLVRVPLIWKIKQMHDDILLALIGNLLKVICPKSTGGMFPIRRRGQPLTVQFLACGHQRSSASSCVVQTRRKEHFRAGGTRMKVHLTSTVTGDHWFAFSSKSVTFGCDSGLSKDVHPARLTGGAGTDSAVCH